MDTIKKQIQLVSIIFLLTTLFNACVEQEINITKPTKGEKTVTFSVQIPGVKTFTPYRLSEADENEVKTIEILLFDTKGKFVHTPLYSDNISTNSTDSRLKSFSVKIPEGSYNMVILANARNILASIIKEIPTGTPKETVIGKLIVSNNGKWNTTPTSPDYMPIPLWGEIEHIDVTQSKSNTPFVHLVRMVAKIDVVLTSETAQNKFKLESIRLYNYNNQGRIAPESINWDANKKHVTAPSIPSSAQKPLDPVNNPLVYDESVITQGISCMNEIYTFETEAGSASSLSQNTCLVIGGKYGSEQQPSYYRIDFAKTSSDKTTYLALLRNHSYKVNINDINAPGVSTPEEAFHSRPINIEAEVIAWNDAIISEIVVNGQYMLGVSKGKFSFSRNEQTESSSDNTLTVTTDYPQGWIVNKIINEHDEPADWLDIVPKKGVAGVDTETKLLLSLNNTGNIRKASVQIEAGRLIYQVQVTQDIKGEIEIRILDSNGESDITELFFTSPASGTPTPEKFIVQWTPSSEIIKIEKGGSLDNFIFDTAYDLPGINETSITDGSGKKTFTIKPRPFTPEEIENTPFMEKSTRITFTIFDGLEAHSKTLYLQQMINMIKPENLGSIYKLDGSTHKITIESNTKWKIKSIQETIIKGTAEKLLNLKPADNLLVGTTGGQAFRYTKTDLSFSVNNLINVEGELTLVLESNDPEQPLNDVSITLKLMNQYIPGKHKGWAATNIYYDPALKHLTFKDKSTSNNEKRRQGVYFKWGSLWGISPVGAYDDSKLLFPPSGGSNFVAETPYANYQSIPYVDETIDLSSNISRAYLYEITNEEKGIGDICKHLTDKGWAPPGKWRMPTQTEISGSFSLTSSEAWVPIVVNDLFGREIIPHAFAGLPPVFTLGLFFPACGMFHFPQQEPVNTGLGTYIWTSTAEGSQSYQLQGEEPSGGIAQTKIRDRQFGLTIRCVKEE